MSASMPAGDGEQLVGRSYTAARRYPLQVGRFANGGRIPGGPYTMTQLAVMIATFVVLVVTRPVWGGHGLVDIVVVLVVPYAGGWGICRVQIDHRNPLAAIASLSGTVFSPPMGRIAGRPWRPRAARLLTPQISIGLQEAAEQATVGGAEAPAASRTPVPASRPQGAGPTPAPPVVSGVQALLAQRAALRGTGR